MTKPAKMGIFGIGLMGIVCGFLIGERPEANAQCKAENDVAIKCSACNGPTGTKSCGDYDGGSQGCVAWGPSCPEEQMP
jgi:hypothetical protein